jgi:hypothetical protein
MSKLKKLHSKNRFFFIVFCSLFLFFFSIFAIFFLRVVLQKITRKKVIYKNVIALQRNQINVDSKEVFFPDKISSKKHASRIIISESFSESYFDLLFNENFVTSALSNTIIKKDNPKNKKITKSKQIAEKKKEQKSLFDQNKKNKKIEVKDNQTKIEVSSSQKNGLKKVSREQSWKKEEKILSSKQSNHEVNEDFLRGGSSSCVASGEVSFFVTNEMQEKNLDNQDFLKVEIAREEKELTAYTDRIVKHIKQFPGKKTKLEIILKTGRGTVTEIFFSPEPRSIAYRNYLMQLLQSSEIPGALREQEVHIFL